MKAGRGSSPAGEEDDDGERHEKKDAINSSRALRGMASGKRGVRRKIASKKVSGKRSKKKEDSEMSDKRHQVIETNSE